MPLWYVVRDGELWAWTYAKSQKIRNLERDPRATLQVEAGESYDQLRGVMIEAETTIHREPETVATLGVELMLATRRRRRRGRVGPREESRPWSSTRRPSASDCSSRRSGPPASIIASWAAV